MVVLDVDTLYPSYSGALCMILNLFFGPISQSYLVSLHSILIPCGHVTVLQYVLVDACFKFPQWGCLVFSFCCSSLTSTNLHSSCLCWVHSAHVSDISDKPLCWILWALLGRQVPTFSTQIFLFWFESFFYFMSSMCTALPRSALDLLLGFSTVLSGLALAAALLSLPFFTWYISLHVKTFLLQIFSSLISSLL